MPSPGLAFAFALALAFTLASTLGDNLTLQGDVLGLGEALAFASGVAGTSASPSPGSGGAGGAVFTGVPSPGFFFAAGLRISALTGAPWAAGLFRGGIGKKLVVCEVCCVVSALVVGTCSGCLFFEAEASFEPKDWISSL